MTLCTRTIHIASIKRLQSNSVHKFAVGLAQNEKLTTRFKTQFLVNFQSIFCVMALNEPFFYS